MSTWLEGKKTYLTALIAIGALLLGKFGYQIDTAGLDNEIVALVAILGTIWGRAVAKPK